MTTLMRLGLTYALTGLAICVLGGLTAGRPRLQEWCWSMIWVWWLGFVIMGFVAVWWLL